MSSAPLGGKTEQGGGYKLSLAKVPRSERRSLGVQYTSWMPLLNVRNSRGHLVPVAEVSGTFKNLRWKILL